MLIFWTFPHSHSVLLQYIGPQQPLFEISSISAKRHSSMMIHDDLWCSMMFYDVRWCSMMFYDALWCSMVFYDVLWCSMMFYDVLCLKSILSFLLSEHTSLASFFDGMCNRKEKNNQSTCSLEELPVKSFGTLSLLLKWEKSERKKMKPAKCIKILNWRSLIICAKRDKPETWYSSDLWSTSACVFQWTILSSWRNTRW